MAARGDQAGAEEVLVALKMLYPAARRETDPANAAGGVSQLEWDQLKKEPCLPVEKATCNGSWPRRRRSPDDLLAERWFRLTERRGDRRSCVEDKALEV